MQSIIRSQSLGSVYSIREFRTIIDRERERADRYHQRFSLAVFEVRTKDENSVVVRRLVRTLYRRFRNIDELGWYASGQIGVILPYTPAHGAWKLAEDVCELVSTIVSPPPFTIYTYPSLNWPGGLSVKIRSMFDILFQVTRGRFRHAIHTGEEFRSVLELERERADRNGHNFSLVLYDVVHAESRGMPAREFIRRLSLRVRETDEIGWFDAGHVGVILPYSSTENAHGMTDSFCNDEVMGPVSKFVIYTYPENWLPDAKKTVETRSVVRESIPPGMTGHTGTGDEQSGGVSAPVCYDTAGEAGADVQTFFVRPIPPWKRTMDIAGSVLGLFVLSPLFLAISVAIKMFSPGPVFFRQPRAGLGGRPFDIYKFRSMVIDAEKRKDDLIQFNERTGPAFKMRDDPRITPVGKFLRKWSLDELPQLINVLLGDMSLVGPRPLPVHEDEGVDQWHMVRRYIRPGITCLWQISARHKSNFDDWVRLDIEYARHQSLLLDMKILLLTVPAVLIRRGAH